MFVCKCVFSRLRCTLDFPSLISTLLERQIPPALCAKDSLPPAVVWESLSRISQGSFCQSLTMIPPLNLPSPPPLVPLTDWPHDSLLEAPSSTEPCLYHAETQDTQTICRTMWKCTLLCNMYLQFWHADIWGQWKPIVISSWWTWNSVQSL